MGNSIKELFVRYEENPILTTENWPYRVGSVFNPGAIRFNGEVLLLVRVEDGRGYSHLTIARSKDGKTDWQISPAPALAAEQEFGEAVKGLEDPRIVWLKERQEYIITCVSFFAGVVGEPPGISLLATKNFKDFQRLGQQLMPANKDGCLLPQKINGYYALINRPIIVGSRADIWVSFSRDLKFWGEHRVLIPVGRDGAWDCDRVGLGSPPIETPEGWLIIYHGARDTASGTLYRVGLVLLDIETLKVIRRSRDWVFGPKENYERVGNVDDIVFPCGTVIDEKTNELLLYYGAADSVVALAIANLKDVIDYLKKCTDF
ncbi:glycosidase [Patescibacteria group bacterium]|nr:glycosidase [Patescibacteria group bacterium]